MNLIPKRKGGKSSFGINKEQMKFRLNLIKTKAQEAKIIAATAGVKKFHVYPPKQQTNPPSGDLYYAH